MLNACIACIAATAPSLQFRHFDEQNGLADLTVKSIVQDRQGFLWFAGQSGLSRYDGYRFSVYRNDFGNPGSLSDIAVQALHIDDQGRLWVGTRSGIQRYDPVADNFVSYLTESRPAARADFLDVRAIAHDTRGNIWLATRNGLR
ncbi:MAG TPA: two-component regulator propeller domain-containing protein, partial [Burkholderiaceae bacterium]|nr:two-component regulator propeller domain-containing protein [Burkholderiaceae bacterium]